MFLSEDAFPVDLYRSVLRDQDFSALSVEEADGPLRFFRFPNWNDRADISKSLDLASNSQKNCKRVTRTCSKRSADAFQQRPREDLHSRRTQIYSHVAVFDDTNAREKRGRKRYVNI